MNMSLILYVLYSMFSIRKKNISSILCLSIFCYGYFWSITIVYAQESTVPEYTTQKYTQHMLENIDNSYVWILTDNKNSYLVMKELCNNIIDWGNYGIYNPKESLFVTIVCNSLLNSVEGQDFSKNSENSNFDFNKVLKQKNMRSMWLICSTSQWSNINITNTTDCTPWTTNNTLDYPRLFKQIITKIQNDIVNLTMARIYGSIDISESDSLVLANMYIANHFFTAWYYPEQKNYPKTVKQLRDYIKIWQQIQKEPYFFDYKKLIDSENEEIIEKKRLRSPFLLATYKQQNSDPLKTNQTYNGWIIDLMYNELFFYTLFMSTYDNYLTRFRSSIDDIPIGVKSLLTTNNREEYINLQKIKNKKQNNDIVKATRESIREIENLDSQFPLHIGLLMYQEDLYNIRNSLANIYLPLHQLHYKLENVQSKD